MKPTTSSSCRVLDRGVNGRRVDELSQPVFEAVGQLIT